MGLITFVQNGEEGNATNLNRPLRDALTALGLDPDADLSAPWLTQAGADALYASIAHTHDDRYYTEAEADALLATKAATVHTHDDRYYTEAESDASLAAKAALVHTHDDRYYTEGEVDSLIAAVGASGGDTGGYGGEHAGTTDIEVWYGAVGVGSPGTIAIGTGNLRAVPFIAPARGGTLDRIAFEVASAAAQTARIGLYSTKGVNNIYPDALLEESADLSCASAAIVSHTVNRALTPGRVYWLAVTPSGTVTFRGLTSSLSSGLLGFSGVWPSSAVISCLNVAHAYGALPNPFPGGATRTAGIIPLLFYRFSA